MTSEDMLIFVTVCPAAIYMVYRGYVSQNFSISKYKPPDNTLISHNLSKITPTDLQSSIDYSFMAFLFTIFRKRTDSCGGTLVHEKHILTAAHCVYGAIGVNIYLGTNNIIDLLTSSKMLQSNKFIIHEEYNFDTYDNDIALIILKEKVELNNHIKIIHLGIDEKSSKNKNCEVLSWGSGNATEGLNDILKSKVVTIFANEQCDLFENKNDNSKICGQGKDGFCYGDSGAPLLFNGSQIGLVSGGDKLCNKSVPTVFTNVAYYLLWIQENIIEDDLMDYDYQMGQPVRNEDYYVDDYDL